MYPAARGGQDAGITQPRDHPLADPCSWFNLETWGAPQTASKGGSPTTDSSGSSSPPDVGTTKEEPQWWNFLASRTERPPLPDGDGEDATTEWSDEMTERYSLGFSMPGEFKIQGSAKEWSLGCVISASWPPLAGCDAFHAT